MILTTDETLIRSILEDETVIDGFSDGKRIENLDIGIYFYEPDVGLFPVNLKGNAVCVHAAIPKKNRGLKALEAAKWLANVLCLKYDVFTQVRHNREHVKRFVKMVGFTHLYDTDTHHFYRYIK